MVKAAIARTLVPQLQLELLALIRHSTLVIIQIIGILQMVVMQQTEMMHGGILPQREQAQQ